ncbi:MAG: GxxExxY protein [Phycisphaerales bacterium]
MTSSTEKINRVAEVPGAWDCVTSPIIGAAMEVHPRLGPVGLEGVFQRVPVIELLHAGLDVREQARVLLTHRDRPIGGVIIDALVNDHVVAQPRAVDEVADAPFAQPACYLRHGDYPPGLPINFRVAHLRNGIRRRVNGRSRHSPPLRPARNPPPSPRLCIAS